MKTCSPASFLSPLAKIFLKVAQKMLLPETTVPWGQLVFICSNSALLMHYYLVVKRLIIKYSIVKIQNFVMSHESRHDKSNPGCIYSSGNQGVSSILKHFFLHQFLFCSDFEV